MKRPFVFVIGMTVGIALAAPMNAHPHIFVDGGIDFIMSGDETLDALSITWLYDEFETLYDLSSRGIEPQPDGTLSNADREAIRAAYSDWPDDFDGSAHLSIDSDLIEMAWPSDLAVDLVDGRLQLTFLRKLETPAILTNKSVEVAFYESTYFFAFAITNDPSFVGNETCEAVVVPYTPGEQSDEMKQSLALLNREETPDIANVGQLFADRIVVNCA
ncbi:DUF1007 family protein [Roseovarius arcticus]|uniref:DUF1007 family protein n=1 Tax=Roseovarius arcticus TaxID=2547404 RepID=UPI001110A8AB|nr:DUF1007 family protein [Roseovarius arcticus]